MGRAYSLGGYLNAVLRRTAPTLVVEGPSDKAAIHRLLAEQTPSARAALIDSVALIEDVTLSGLGAKAKIFQIQTEVEAAAIRHTKLLDCLAFMTDREWDGIQLNIAALSETWNPPEQTENHFVTLGHSIENYHFDIEFVQHYLRHAFSEHCTQQLDIAVQNYFGRAIALAGALSVTALNAGYLTRMTGLVSHEHIESRDGHLHLGVDFCAAAASRGIAETESFREAVNRAVIDGWADFSTGPIARWVVHGHIGSDVIWASIGYLALASGCSPKTAEQISKGMRDERRRCFLSWLSSVSAQKRHPLDLAVTWLTKK